MAPHYFNILSDGSQVDITDYFQLYELEVTTQAEEGSVGTSTITAYDPDGTFQINGHTKVYISEPEAASGEQVIYVGYAAERVYKRGDSELTEDARIIEITVTDINTLLNRRVMVGADGKRPEETDVDRVEWALSTNEAGLINDSTYLDQNNTYDMDAVDYRSQYLASIFDDAAQQSGKNWFVWYKEDTNDTSMWYDYASSSNFSSSLRLSNVLADIDLSTTYPIADGNGTQLSRDPSRVYSGVDVAYDGGYTYVQDQATASNFARRDVVTSAPNVKTAAKAKIRGNRYLHTLDTEDDRITTRVLLPNAKVNQILAGHRIQFKASHLPGYEDFEWVRVVRRTVRQRSEQFYELELELTAPAPQPTPTAVYGVLYGSDGPHSDVVYFARTGDNPGPGWNLAPKSGLIDYLEDPSPPHGRPFYGFEVTGTGTINVTGFITTYGIKLNNIAYTWTVSICKNGTPVETITHNPTPGNLSPEGWDPVIIKNGIPVVPGDLITLELTTSPSFPAFWRTPRGSGQNGERLEITGGSLV